MMAAPNFADLLRALKAGGSTVVVVGHRPTLLAELDKIAVMNDGAIQAFGPAVAVLAGSNARNARCAASRPETIPGTAHEATPIRNCCACRSNAE